MKSAQRHIISYVIFQVHINCKVSLSKHTLVKLLCKNKWNIEWLLLGLGNVMCSQLETLKSNTIAFHKRKEKIYFARYGYSDFVRAILCGRLSCMQFHKLIIFFPLFLTVHFSFFQQRVIGIKSFLNHVCVGPETKFELLMLTYFMPKLQVSILFKEWYRICELPGANDTASAHFILQLHQNGLLKGDDLTDRFFRLLLVWLFFHHAGYSFLLMTRIVSVTSFLVLFFFFSRSLLLRIAYPLR